MTQIKLNKIYRNNLRFCLVENNDNNSFDIFQIQNNITFQTKATQSYDQLHWLLSFYYAKRADSHDDKQFGTHRHVRAITGCNESQNKY